MPKILIKNLGPIKNVELDIKNLNILFGKQARGKSTIIKTIYFFMNFAEKFVEGITQDTFIVLESLVEIDLYHEFADKFNDFIKKETFIKYYFTEEHYIIIGKGKADFSVKLKELKHRIFKMIEEDLNEQNKKLDFGNIQIESLFPEISKETFAILNSTWRKEIEFDYNNIIFIPASRSSINRLQKYSRIIASKEADFMTSLDWTISEFISTLSLINKSLETGIKDHYSKLESLVKFQKIAVSNIQLHLELKKDAIQYIDKILNGEYKNIKDEERIYLNNDDFVKLDNASSGQQEALSILNMIYYFLDPNRKVCLFIEEPEAHLFPEAQMHIINLIALLANVNSTIFVTTHSPYILSASNNLIYAHYLSRQNNNDLKEISEIVNKNTWINSNNLYVGFVDEGKSIDILDKENNIINGDYLDNASEIIIDTFTELHDRFIAEGELC